MSLVSLLYKPVLLVCLLFATVAVSRRFCDKEDGICPDTPESTMSAKEFVDAKIKTGPVVVFSKTYCPYCHSTKKLFKDLGVAIIVVELDERDDGAAIQDYLQKLTGGRSVPRVFVGGNFVGGADATADAHKAGKLVPQIKAAGGL